MRARGPSPRARGADWLELHQVGEVGTIPACAGSSCMVSASARNDSGPSPRARGAVSERVRGQRGRGTIPACAGSRPGGCPPRSRRRDHPRVRGEQLYWSGRSARPSGPSPRARGADLHGCGQDAGDGTIPACAGSRLAELRVYRCWVGNPSTFTDSGNSGQMTLVTTLSMQSLPPSRVVLGGDVRPRQPSWLWAGAAPGASP